MSDRNQSCCLEPTEHIGAPLATNRHGSCRKNVERQRIISDLATFIDVQRAVASLAPFLERVHTHTLVRHSYPRIARANDMLGRLEPVVLAVVALRDVVPFHNYSTIELRC